MSAHGDLHDHLVDGHRLDPRRTLVGVDLARLTEMHTFEHEQHGGELGHTHEPVARGTEVTVTIPAELADAALDCVPVTPRRPRGRAVTLPHPVGTRVRVSPFGDREPFVAVISGFDLHVTKYRLRKVFWPGHPDSFLGGDHGTLWAFEGEIAGVVDPADIDPEEGSRHRRDQVSERAVRTAAIVSAERATSPERRR